MTTCLGATTGSDWPTSHASVVSAIFLNHSKPVCFRAQKLQTIPIGACFISSDWPSSAKWQIPQDFVQIWQVVQVLTSSWAYLRPHPHYVSPVCRFSTSPEVSTAVFALLYVISPHTWTAVAFKDLLAQTFTSSARRCEVKDERHPRIRNSTRQ